jgi:hypothetical protein
MLLGFDEQHKLIIGKIPHIVWPPEQAEINSILPKERETVNGFPPSFDYLASTVIVPFIPGCGKQ